MSQSPDPDILYDTRDAVFTLQIDRPAKKNALTPSMYAALAEGIRQAENDAGIHVILIRGSGDCFTSGNDVNSFVTGEEDGGERPSVRFMKAIAGARKPVIAAVGGLAIGIGTTLLLHCDLVYAAEDAYLQLPFTRLGLCPEAGSSLLLPRLCGHQRAAELLLTGERIAARKAQQYGLVNEVLPSTGYLEYATGKAVELAKLPAESVQVSKALIKRDQQPALDAVVDEELEQFTRLLQTPEAQAILQAFLDRSK